MSVSNVNGSEGFGGPTEEADEDGMGVGDFMKRRA
jgi:hypothetical protein